MSHVTYLLQQSSETNKDGASLLSFSKTTEKKLDNDDYDGDDDDDLPHGRKGLGSVAIFRLSYSSGFVSMLSATGAATRVACLLYFFLLEVDTAVLVKIEFVH